jgi:hypothetical protein
MYRLAPRLCLAFIESGTRAIERPLKEVTSPTAENLHG